MKYTFHLVVLASLCIGGCHSYVSSVLRDANLGMSISSVQAAGVWSTGEPGHGLQIHVLAERDAGDYERNLDLELADAAKVCARLATSDPVLEWAYIDVYLTIKYLQFPSTTRNVCGIAEVIVRGDTLRMLREKNAPASEYAKHWRFISGYKDQPDSDTLLSW